MQCDKLRWWPIYQEPEHELTGRIQLYINYSTTPDESNHPKVYVQFCSLIMIRVFSLLLLVSLPVESAHEVLLRKGKLQYSPKD